MKLWSTILVMCAAIISLASCDRNGDRNDGDWDSMKWKAEVKVQKTNGSYNVSADGETIIFSCRNYSSFWFTDAKVDGETIYPSYMGETDNKLMDNDYFRAEIHGNEMTIEFKVNESSQVRNISIGVTAGDIFDTFKFKQLAGSVVTSE